MCCAEHTTGQFGSGDMSFASVILESRHHLRKGIPDWERINLGMLVAGRQGQEQWWKGILLNLSEGGLAVLPFRRLMPGCIHRVRLANITCSANLVWVDASGRAGIRFLELSRKARTQLRQWIDHAELEPQLDHGLTRVSWLDRETTTLNEALGLIAERAKTATGAGGAAIALGDSAGMKCLTSVGVAPTVGVQVGPDSGLTGHCLRTGELIVCADLLAEHPQYGQLARDFNLRSVAIVPVSVSGRLRGLLQVLSPQPSVFRPDRIECLTRLSDVIAAVIQEKELKLSSAFPLPVAAGSETGLNGSGGKVAGEAAAEVRPKWRRFAAAVAVLGLLFALSAMLYRHFAGAGVASSAASPPPQSSTVRAQPVAAPEQKQRMTGGRPALGFSRPSISAQVGSTFTVHVMLKGATDISSAPVKLFYDPNTLLLMSVSDAGLLSQDGRSVGFVHRDDKVAGIIQMSVARPPQVPGISGTGAVFTLVFLAKAPGTSALKLDTVLRDSEMRQIPADTSNATVVVGH